MTTRELAQRRDIPASCICLWQYQERGRCWLRKRQAPGCPWHKKPAVEDLESVTAARRRVLHAETR